MRHGVSELITKTSESPGSVLILAIPKVVAEPIPILTFF